MPGTQCSGPLMAEHSPLLSSGPKTRPAAAVAAGVISFQPKPELHTAETRRGGAATCTASRRCTGRMERFSIRLRQGLPASAGHAPIRPVVPGATQIGRGGTSDLQSGPSGPASKNLRRFFLMCCSAKLVIENPSGRKLVVFSDSRQDAAKLSAGMRFCTLPRLHPPGPRCGSDQPKGGRTRLHCATQRRSADSSAVAAADDVRKRHMVAKRPYLSMAQRPMANQPSPHLRLVLISKPLSILSCAPCRGLTRIAQLAIDVSSQLLRRGMNPGGYSQDVLWTYPDTARGPWSGLYNWPAGMTPSAKLKQPARR